MDDNVRSPAFMLTRRCGVGTKEKDQGTSSEK